MVARINKNNTAKSKMRLIWNFTSELACDELISLCLTATGSPYIGLKDTVKSPCREAGSALYTDNLMVEYWSPKLIV